jgi:hypothetical protein
MQELERMRARHAAAAAGAVSDPDTSGTSLEDHLVLGPAAVAVATGLRALNNLGLPQNGGGSGSCGVEDFGTLTSSDGSGAAAMMNGIGIGGGRGGGGGGGGGSALAPWGLPVIHDDAENEGERSAEPSGAHLPAGGVSSASAASAPRGAVQAAVKTWESGASGVAACSPPPLGAAAAFAGRAPAVSGGGAVSGREEEEGEELMGSQSIYIDEDNGFGSTTCASGEKFANSSGKFAEKFLAAGSETYDERFLHNETMTDVVPLPAGEGGEGGEGADGGAAARRGRIQAAIAKITAAAGASLSSAASGGALPR